MAYPIASILHVDDNRNDLLLTRQLLESAGYRVLDASDSKEALRIVKQVAIDLVLSDYNLRDTNGTQLARELKEVCPNILVAILSGTDDPPTDLAVSADAFIGKDVGPAQILEMIASLLSRQERLSTWIYDIAEKPDQGTASKALPFIS